MKLAAIQHDIVWEDRDATLAHLAPEVAAAAAAGAQLVSFTEMFATGFSMETHRTAEPPDGPTSCWMAERASQHGVWIAGSVPILDPGRELPTNALLVVGPDGSRHRYDKRHPFSHAGEHERFAAGEQHVSITLEGVRIGLSVCYDLRFANAYWDRGPDVDAFLVVANWPAARREHWRCLLRARAIENQVYVVGVNRVGSGGGLDYAGDSCVIDPTGEVLVAAAGAETTLFAELDADHVAATRDRFRFLPDRR
jgi:predicted amidohydrolase